MYAQVEKPKDKKSITVANSVAQKKRNGKQGMGFVDNRVLSRVQNSTLAPRVIQRVTEINYTSRNVNWQSNWAGGLQNQNMGVNTEAYLDPVDPKTGSRTSPGGGIYATGFYNAINNGHHLTQGHLLNANLGGQAIPENLFPITADMNRAHSSQVEEQVKSQFIRLNREQVNGIPGWAGRRLHYQVQAIHPAPLTRANLRSVAFRCNAAITQADGVTTDAALGALVNYDVTVPNNLNDQIAAIDPNWVPDANPTHQLGHWPGLPHAVNVRTVNDAFNVPIPGMTITI